MKYLIPALYFLLPSLQQPGKLVPVHIDKLPKTKYLLEKSADPDITAFRHKWKVASHSICQKNGYHCAKSLLVYPDGAKIDCITYDTK